MSLARFLEVLFRRGEVVFRKPPIVGPPRDADALDILAREYKRYRLDLPGRVPDLDPDVALQAADVLRHACWFMLSREENDDEVHARVSWQGTASTPMQHYSADLTLRFAARVHRRAKALKPEDSLVRALEGMLRRRPLSGVLCDIEEPPIALEFGDHEGLMLLYAERFAAHPKEGWLPGGRPGEYVELVRERITM